MKRTVRAWEMAGIIVILLVGPVLHFAFEWSGCWRPLAVVAAVNESVWEHLKLAFWPGLAWAALEFLTIRRQMANFWVAKAAGLLIMPLVIGAGFYSYSAILGDHSLAIDILLFVLAVLLGQLASYRLANAGALPPALIPVALSVLVALVAAFSLLSYFPPHLDPWRDSASGSFGLLTRP
jgi:hypothetical protein